jgi:enoyl-CoA hydratase
MQMSEPAVLLERQGRIAVVTLNRPEQANTFNAALLRYLHAVTTELAADTDVHIVILTGAGRHFSGGADLKESSEQRRESRERHGEARDMSRLPQPVIAAINGAALGGGCEIALTCDFRFMAANAFIGLPEIQFGSLPLGGGTARLPRLVGIAAAKRMIMTGDPIGAEEAERIGLVEAVAVPGATLAAAGDFAARLLERPDYALRAAKALLNQTLEVDLESALALEWKTVKTMATREQFAKARREAAERISTYANIFDHTSRGDGEPG